MKSGVCICIVLVVIGLITECFAFWVGFRLEFWFLFGWFVYLGGFVWFKVRWCLVWLGCGF